MGNRFRRFIGYFKLHHALYLIPICAFAVYDSVFSAFSSILALLSDTYPTVSTEAIQMVIAIPALVSIPATLLSGVLAAYVRKKYIAEASLVLMLVGGLIPVVLTSPEIHALYISSAFIGIGQGLLHPLASSLVCQFWEKGKDRSRALGFKQAMNYLGAAVVSLIVGLLAFSQWNIAYFVYLGIIPVFIISHVLLPKGDLEKRLIDKAHKAEGLKKLLAPKCIYIFILFFFAMLFGFAFHTNIAMLVSEKNLGTVIDISVISAILNIVSFIIGICYGKIVKTMRRYTLFIGFLILAAGFFIVAFGTSLPVVIAGSVLYGVGTGIQQVTTIFNTSRAVEKSMVSMAISMVLVFVSAGQSVSPLVVGFLKGMLFGAGSGAQAAMFVAGIGFLVLSAVEFACCHFFLPDPALQEDEDGSEAEIATS